MDERLLLVADPVDGACLVISDQQGAVRRLKDVVGTARIFWSSSQEPAKTSPWDSCRRVDRDEDDPVANLLVPVPRAMLGDEDAVLVLAGTDAV